VSVLASAQALAGGMLQMTPAQEVTTHSPFAQAFWQCCGDEA